MQSAMSAGTRARVVTASFTVALNFSEQHSALTFPSRPKNRGEVIPGDGITRRIHQNLPKYLLGLSRIRHGGINLCEIHELHARCGCRLRQVRLIKDFFVRPIPAPNKAASAQGDDRQQVPQTPKKIAPTYWATRCTARNENQQTDAWKIEPMFRHCSVKLNDVGDRKISCEETKSTPNNPHGSAPAVPKRRKRTARTMRPKIDKYSIHNCASARL